MPIERYFNKRAFYNKINVFFAKNQIKVLSNQITLYSIDQIKKSRTEEDIFRKQTERACVCPQKLHVIEYK